MTKYSQEVIKSFYNKLKAMESEIYKEIESLQKACKHPKKTKEYKSNTGNYDPASDCYWARCECPDCGKIWSVDSDDPEYRK